MLGLKTDVLNWWFLCWPHISCCFLPWLNIITYVAVIVYWKVQCIFFLFVRSHFTEKDLHLLYFMTYCSHGPSCFVHCLLGARWCDGKHLLVLAAAVCTPWTVLNKWMSKGTHSVGIESVCVSENVHLCTSCVWMHKLLFSKCVFLHTCLIEKYNDRKGHEKN